MWYDLPTDQTKQNSLCPPALWVACVFYRKNQTLEICNLVHQSPRSNFTHDYRIQLDQLLQKGWERTWSLVSLPPAVTGLRFGNSTDHSTDIYLTHSSTDKPIKTLPPPTILSCQPLCYIVKIFSAMTKTTRVKTTRQKVYALAKQNR